MKKIQFSLMTVAVALGISGAAIGTRPYVTEYVPNKEGTGYVLFSSVSGQGSCLSGGTSCKYMKNAQGQFVPINPTEIKHWQYF